MNKQRKFKYFGPVGTKWLESIGIDSMEQLGKIGSVEAYHKIKERHPGANIVMLYALEAALWDLPWNELPSDLKEQLKASIGYTSNTKNDWE